MTAATTMATTPGSTVGRHRVSSASCRHLAPVSPLPLQLPPLPLDLAEGRAPPRQRAHRCLPTSSLPARRQPRRPRHRLPSCRRRRRPSHRIWRRGGRGRHCRLRCPAAGSGREGRERGETRDEEEAKVEKTEKRD
uniref:Uncharacterized protein n=1 Tax=Oryza sativa subsp. japonica TaxID=39947 RepID=Q6EQB9_ORYSJ|nr:hypothetical protein [Oryza sativa Japonica Group]BAD29151.1 hypothetical protein [Oryza sativa Japonica Group]